VSFILCIAEDISAPEIHREKEEKERKEKEEEKERGKSLEI